MENILLLESVVKEKVYGGKKIAKILNLENSDERKIGEYWAISGHPNGESIIKNGSLKGTPLNTAFLKHPELFNNSSYSKFPLLIKLIHIVSPVSVQVHPNNEYARIHENDYGKAEFCLFLETHDNSYAIHGHTAKTKEEFKDLIAKKDMDTLLIKKKLNNNDYVFNDAGCLHGLLGELLMLEVQQSSDVTYRIYDYDNTDKDGNPRELHIEQATDVTCIPHVNEKDQKYEDIIQRNRHISYTDNQYFKIDRYQINKSIDLENDSYMLLQVIKGKGKIIADKEYDLNSSTPMIVTSKCKNITIKGELDLIITREGNK